MREHSAAPSVKKMEEHSAAPNEKKMEATTDFVDDWMARPRRHIGLTRRSQSAPLMHWRSSYEGQQSSGLSQTMKSPRTAVGLIRTASLGGTDGATQKTRSSVVVATGTTTMEL